jgi:hypothetical protein
MSAMTFNASMPQNRPLLYLRGLRSNRQWQKSSAISATIWLVGTLIVYKLVERLGYGWEINTTVSLMLDTIAYVAHKLWVFKRDGVTIGTSCSRNVIVWLAFFSVNLFLSWIVFNKVDLGTLSGRSILGCYGVAMNPVMFFIRDKGIFSHKPLRELLSATWQAIRRNRKA